MMPSRKKRIVFYSQHLIGVGHHFRNRQIVSELAKAHDVWFVNGGRSVPGAELPDSVTCIQLSPLQAGRSGLEPSDPEKDLDSVLQERQAQLVKVMDQAHPDVFCIEFFPFCRWPLRPEIIGAIEAAAAVHPGVKVICSLRDIPTRAPTAELQPPEMLPTRLNGDALRFYSVPFGGTHHEHIQMARRYYEEVCPTLNTHFDALLVHGDPNFSRLEDHFPWVEDIAIPIVYTGFVSERLTNFAPLPDAPDRYVIVSAGGGAEGYTLAAPCIEAWKQLSAQGNTEDREMVIFAGAFIDDVPFTALKNLCADGPFRLERFATDFLRWMHNADLSINRAGYNTCMNVLETRTQALLIPIVQAGDQEFRALKLAEKGIVEMIHPDALSSGRLADAILRKLSHPVPDHKLDLDGAQRTLEFVEQL